jgi:hypothetical protein
MNLLKSLSIITLFALSLLIPSIVHAQTSDQHREMFFIYQGVGKGSRGENNAKYTVLFTILNNNDVEGFIDIDPLFGSSTNNCAAGNLSGKIDSATRRIRLSFISFDSDPGCGWDHGYRVELDGKITPDLQQVTLVLQSYTPSGRAYFRENVLLSLKRKF